MGDEGRGLGGEGRGRGRGRGRGLRCICVSSPRCVFFQCFIYILVTFFYSEMLLDKRMALGRNQDDNDDNYDGNKGWEW